MVTTPAIISGFELSAEQFAAILPLVILGAGALLSMLIGLVRVNTKRPAQLVGVATLVAAFWSLYCSASTPAFEAFNGAIEISGFTRTGMTLIFLSTLGIVIGSSRYLTREKIHISDFYHLVLLSVFGASIMICARDLLSLFISLELMSLPIYTLVGFRRNDSRSNEASIKYFMVGAVIGAIFFLGSSLIFGATGSVQFVEIAKSLATLPPEQQQLFFAGLMLTIIAFLTKVASVPFQIWKPDVYEGAPVPVTGLMATVVTTASFFVLVKLCHLVDGTPFAGGVEKGLLVLAISSLVFGSFVVVTQTNVKRLLAYSSIANAGYMLLAVAGSFKNPDALSGLWMYLAAYATANVGIFMLLSMTQVTADSGMDLVDFTGLIDRNPILVCFWSIFLFSLAGFPLTFGFIGKFVLFKEFLKGEAGIWVIFAVLCNVVSAYAYLRPIALMIMRDSDRSAGAWKGSTASILTVFVFAAMTVGFGIYPKHMIELLKRIPLFS